VPVSLTMERVEESAGVDSVKNASGNSDALDCEHDDLPQGRDHFIWGHHDGKAPPMIALDAPQLSSGASTAIADHVSPRSDAQVRSISAITGYSIEAAMGKSGTQRIF
jgi:hypothetical protein